MVNCNDGGCTCVIQAGPGVTITGAGSSTSPMVISSDLALSQSFVVNDTATVNLQLVGGGVPGNPLILSATATVALTQLSDVNDPGGPAVGDVPVWIGVGSAGHWEFQPPPAVPAGSVNVDVGLGGTGSLIDPIYVKMIGTTFGGTTAGLEVYADSAGNLRAVAPAATAVAWVDITGKPSTFAPSAHTHVAADITNPLFLSVGDSVRVGGHQVFVQSTAPVSGMVTNDLWFW